ncbi:hypothetical protein DER45DRAFT_89055 [Fusarium avenaceum]|nr:hypothetical protein DER45DRAFT_89055 [Fusarium avenaceum]
MSSPSSTSQYGGHMCSIWFKNKGPLRVSIDVLKKCPKLVARLNSRSHSSGPPDQANISDISPSSGHVIIHYLVTERYQSLKPTGTTQDKRNRSELETAFKVHVRAGFLDLPGLQELAQSEMKRLVSQMNLISVAQTLEDTGISLNRNPLLEALLADQIDLALTQSSKESLNSLTTQLGLPKTVSMFFLEHILETQKSLLDVQGCNDEESSTDLSWAQFGKEFQALVQKFSRLNPTDKDLVFQRGLLVETVRESLEKTALEQLSLGCGRPNDTHIARLKTLQSNETSRVKLLTDCETNIAATKEHVRHMNQQAELITKQLIKEKRYESLLQWHEAQHGALYPNQCSCQRLAEDHGERDFYRYRGTAEEMTSRGTDESSDDGIMTPRTGSVHESAIETPSLLAKHETVRPSRAESERIARQRLEMDNKRIRRHLQEQERLSGVLALVDFVILFVLIIVLVTCIFFFLR